MRRFLRSTNKMILEQMIPISSHFFALLLNLLNSQQTEIKRYHDIASSSSSSSLSPPTISYYSCSACRRRLPQLDSSCSVHSIRFLLLPPPNTTQRRKQVNQQRRRTTKTIYSQINRNLGLPNELYHFYFVRETHEIHLRNE